MEHSRASFSEPGSERHTLARAGRGLRWMPWLVLALTLFLSVWAWLVARESTESVYGARFAFQVEEIISALDKRMNAYELVLRSGVGLFQVKGQDVTREQWRTFVDSLRLTQDYPGILGVGFSRWLAPDQLQAHERRVRAEGFPDYRVWPEGERAQYTAIEFLEPFDSRNQRAFGYDMYSEPVRRAAMQRAMETSNSELSGKITLVQEDGEDIQAGFLIYIPVFSEAADERRPLHGFVYSPFRAEDFVNAVLAERWPSLAIELFDGTAPDEEQLLYRSEPLTRALRANAQFQRQEFIDFHGRPWTVRAYALPGYVSDHDLNIPTLVLAAGILTSLLLFVIAYSLVQTRARALGLAQRMTSTLRERTRRLHEITATLGEGVIVENDAGRIDFVNPAAAEMLGWSEEDLLGRPAGELFEDPSLPADEQTSGFWERLTGGRADDNQPAREVRLRCKDGHSFPASVIARPLAHGTDLAGSVVAFRDITEEKHAEEALRENEQFKALFDYSMEGLFLLDEAGLIKDVNRRACDSLGYSHDELTGVSPERFMPDLQFSIGTRSLPEFLQRMGDREAIIGEDEYKRADGGLFPVEAVISPVRIRQQRLYLVAFRDITARKESDEAIRRVLKELSRARTDAENANRQLEESNARLEEMARQDALTGLANRRSFNEYFDTELHRAMRSAQPLAVILADVDHFKSFNDRYGHQAGDRCLQQIARAMQQCLHRSTDLLARYGGEEFVLILPDTDLEGATHLAEELRQAVEDLGIPHERSTTAEVVTLSAGVTSVIPGQDISMETLVRTADDALYEAKRQGRNRVKRGPVDSPLEKTGSSE